MSRLAALADRRRRIGVGLVLLFAAVPFTTTDYYTLLVLTGLVYVLLGVSWDLLAGYAGQISLGHAAFFGLGAFVSAWLTTPGDAGLPTALQLPWLASLPFGSVLLLVYVLVVSGLAVALLAIVIGPFIFRLHGHYFAIGTLALATIIEIVLNDLRQFSGGATGYFVDPAIGGTWVYLFALAATVGTIVFAYRIVDRPIGLGMQAIHGDEGAAESLGVNPLKYKMYAFAMSSFLAGLAGAFWAQYKGFISASSTLGVHWTIDTLVVVVLGGMGTITGPILGAGLFLVLDNFLTGLVGELATTVEGLVIILVVVFLPDGLYGLVRDRVPALMGDESPPMDTAPETDETEYTPDEE